MNSTGPRNMGYDVLLTSHISMVIVILSDALVAGTYVWLYWQMFTYIRFRHKQCTWDLSTFGGPVAKDWDLIPRLKSESIVSSPSPFKPASSSSCQNQPNQSHTTITIKQYTPIINKVTHNHIRYSVLKWCISQSKSAIHIFFLYLITSQVSKQGLIYLSITKSTGIQNNKIPW